MEITIPIWQVELVIMSIALLISGVLLRYAAVYWWRFFWVLIQTTKAGKDFYACALERRRQKKEKQ